LIITRTGDDPISGECELLDIKKFWYNSWC
jgi:hypothetical protein